MQSVLKRKKWKKNDYIKFGIGLGVGAFLLTSTVVFYEKIKIPHIKETITIAIRNEIARERNEQRVYIAKKDIPSNTLVTFDMFKQVYIPSCAISSDALKRMSDIEGRVTRFNIKAKTPISTGMLNLKDDEIKNDTKLQDFKEFVLNEGLAPNDWIDIIIRYPNGTFKTVVAKKRVIDCKEGRVTVSLDDTDRTLLYNAMVSAMAVDKTLMQTLKYADPANQAPAKVNYSPNQSLQNLIEKNYDIVNLAKRVLEQRKKEEERKQTQVKPVIDPTTTATTVGDGNGLQQGK